MIGRRRRLRVVREAVPFNVFHDNPCDGCTSGWPPLWRLRTTRGRLLAGAWCGECVLEQEALRT